MAKSQLKDSAADARTKVVKSKQQEKVFPSLSQTVGQRVEDQYEKVLGSKHSSYHQGHLQGNKC